MRKIFIALLMLCSLPAIAQVDRHEVRSGNRQFRKDNFKEAEISYRKAVLKDSLSVAGEYNLASTLYRLEDYENAGKALETIKDVASVSPSSTQYYYNLGDVALQKKDYGAAMEAFKQALLRDPSDMDAKENYIYAKLMKQNEDQNGGGGGGDGQNDQKQDQNDQNQDQNNDQNQNGQNDQDQNQDQNQNGDQPKDQNQDQQPQQQPQPQEQKISPQQAQQMLQAIQAKEKETQDKVKKEKAELLQSKQKEKNW